MANTNAQECPEFKNMVNAISNSESVTLETPATEIKNKKKGLYRGFDSSIRLEGANSPVKISGNATFIFKPKDAEMHPSQQIKLYPFESSKDFRELSTGGVNMFGGTKNRKNDDDSVSLKFEKVSPGCYKVDFGKLPKGEYAFCLGENPDVQGQGFISNSTSYAWFAFAVK